MTGETTIEWAVIWRHEMGEPDVVEECDDEDDARHVARMYCELDAEVVFCTVTRSPWQPADPQPDTTPTTEGIPA